MRAAIETFHAHGVGVSTAKVADAAGVSNGTLFNYFPTKQALIDALYLSIKTDLAGAIGSPDPELSIEARGRELWEAWRRWARANRPAHSVMNLLHHSGLASAAVQIEAAELFGASMQVLVEANELGTLVPLPLDYLAALIGQQLDHAITAELDDSQSAVAFDVLWNGITNSPDQRALGAKRKKAPL